MKVYREDDPMDHGWTTTSNDTLWSDLSCRALGLLIRWLSKPSGVEVDTIPEIVTRAKRRGSKRMEGRDALYSASYELELEGFLVRRQIRSDETGQYEWAAFISNRPVPAEARSNPADRKRTTALPKKPAKGKPKRAPEAAAADQPSKTPVPENPFLAVTCDDAASSQVSPVPGNPEPENPYPGFQAFSYKDSPKYSLSGQQPSQAPDQGRERETAQLAPEAKTSDDATAVAAAWTAARKAAGYPGRLRGTETKIAREAMLLLADGWDLRTLKAAAVEMAPHGWSSLEKHLASAKGQVPTQATAVSDWCGECDGPDIAERQIVVDGEYYRCPACHPAARTGA